MAARIERGDDVGRGQTGADDEHAVAVQDAVQRAIFERVGDEARIAAEPAKLGRKSRARMRRRDNDEIGESLAARRRVNALGVGDPANRDDGVPENPFFAKTKVARGADLKFAAVSVDRMP
jgi:hypothetical protein